MVHVAVLLLTWLWYGTVPAPTLVSHELRESVAQWWMPAWFAGVRGRVCKEEEENEEREYGRRRRENT